MTAILMLTMVVPAGLWLAAGCSVDSGTVGANQPPETVLTFAGPVGTVNSHVRLRWWGEDPDGDVVGYEYRWTLAGEGGAEWVFTTATTDSFALPAPTGAALHAFEVRAVDDGSAVDPTPARQDYSVSNAAPVVAFASESTLPTTSLPAVTIVFVVSDGDGNETVAEVVGWLDGQDPDVAGRRVPYPGNTITFGPEDFDHFGERTVFLKAIDDGLAESEPISHTLEIVEPVGDTVLIDDMPDGIAGGSRSDDFYRGIMDEVMAGAPYTIHKIENSSLRTPAEASAIFALFDHVIWYQGTNGVVDGEPVPVSTFSLGNAQGAIRELLDRGGSMLLATMNAVGTHGAFEDDFAREVLGVDTDAIETNPDADEEGDTNFFFKTRYRTGQELWWLGGRGDGVYEDVRVVGSFWGLELFTAAPGADVLYTIPAGVVREGMARRTVGTRVRRGTGTVVFLGFALSRCSFQSRHQDVLRAVLQTEFGLPGGGLQ